MSHQTITEKYFHTAYKRPDSFAIVLKSYITSAENAWYSLA
nr:MAG TPA: hypothetical protein [Caudoviricetes sp.]DAY00940.1 MAG TPA: hypothetical protein [Caudoviricetes sp.]